MRTIKHALGVLALLAGGAPTAFAYVPEPQPVKSDVEITAIYYPGTEQMSEWDIIAATSEAIDWQIKWAVEHGITSFCVDWYWNKGYRRLEHWLKGYYRAKYRGYLKWFMMYANHNQPGSHSTEDQIAVTKYWIDNYFKTPEYYTIDGKPAVCIWDAGNLDRDFIDEAAAKGGWIDMWRTKKFDPTYAKRRVEQGYRAAIHYGIEHFSPALSPEAMKPGDTRNRFGYDAVVATAPKIWDELSRQNVLPFWVIIPTGWDDRPRSFTHSRVITDRTPEKFAEICRRAKAFCDKYGRKHAIVMPISEWQEGSYIEPNEEYGFGMYDAIRDAFCEKPAGGWPKNLRPADVGMGPYDYPPLVAVSPTQRWDFTDSVEGWYRQPYGGGELEAKDGCLNFWVNFPRRNYNIRQRVVPFEAAKYKTFRVRMRVTPNAKAGSGGVKNPDMRLKWGTAEHPIIGSGLAIDERRCVASCPVKVDGEFYEYAIDLSANPDWKGMVDELWFEACPIMHARVAVDWMRFE